MATISGIFTLNGLPRNGALAKLFPSGAPFTVSPPIKNTPFPVSGLLQSVTTGEAHGGDGAYRFLAVNPGSYFVGVSYNGQTVWDSFFVPTTLTATVRDYGALGDGATNDTVAIQAALDDTTIGEVLFPPGDYLCNNLKINSRSSFRVRGTGGVIKWAGTAAAGQQIGFQIAGTCRDVEIEGLRMDGNNTGASGHCALWCLAGEDLEDIRLRSCRVSLCARGVVLNAATGVLRHILVENCWFDQPAGTAAVQGEGVFIDYAGADAADVRIVNCVFEDVDRHDIFVNQGRGILIQGCQSYKHRGSVATVALVPAFRLRGAIDTTIADCQFFDCKDGSVSIVTAATIASRNVAVRGCSFVGTANAIADVTVGTSDPATDGFPEEVKIEGNTFYKSAVNIAGINLLCGKRALIGDNTVTILGISAGTIAGIVLAGQSEGAGTSDYSDDLHLEANLLYGTTAGGTFVGISLLSAFCTSGVKACFIGNRVTGGNDFLSGAAVTDTNLAISAQKLDGLTVSLATALATLYSTPLIAFRPIKVIATADSPYTLLGTDDIVIAGSGGGAITVAPPTAVGRRNRLYSVTREGANTVTVDPAGAETIGGAATYVLGADGATVSFVSDGANWRIVSSGV